ncbi:MAG: hypothetical protein ABIO86_11625 [Sphingomonas sp.]
MIDGAEPARAAISPRFALASVALSTPQTISHERAAEVSAKAEHVTAKAEAHFEKHRQVWTNRQYSQLLARDGQRMELRPPGMVDDRKAHLMRAADHLVRQRQCVRLSSISRAAENMMKNGSEKNRSHDLGR